MKTRNCYKCLHFVNTYDPGMPYACSLLGFRSIRLPSIAVQESTGEDCRVFEEKAPKTGDKETPDRKDPLKNGGNVDLEA